MPKVAHGYPHQSDHFGIMWEWFWHEFSSRLLSNFSKWFICCVIYGFRTDRTALVSDACSHTWCTTQSIAIVRSEHRVPCEAKDGSMENSHRLLPLSMRVWILQHTSSMAYKKRCIEKLKIHCAASQEDRSRYDCDIELTIHYQFPEQECWHHMPFQTTGWDIQRDSRSWSQWKT